VAISLIPYAKRPFFLGELQYPHVLEYSLCSLTMVDGGPPSSDDDERDDDEADDDDDDDEDAASLTSENRKRAAIWRSPLAMAITSAISSRGIVGKMTCSIEMSASAAFIVAATGPRAAAERGSEGASE